MRETLPPVQLVARNVGAGGDNPIHDDAAARRHGFPGALVPGVTLYAGLVPVVVAALGAAWLERGTAEVRFLRPVLDGERLTVTGARTTGEDGTRVAALAAHTARAGECVRLTAALPAAPPPPVDPTRYPAAPLPLTPPPASRAVLERLGPLGSPRVHYDAERAARDRERAGQPLAPGEPPHGVAHPAVYLELANRAVDRNVRVGPWIHVASQVRHLGAVPIGAWLEARGRVAALWERRGHEYVDLDLVIVAEPGGRAAAHVRHTAIYRLAAPPPPAAAPGPQGAAAPATPPEPR